MKILPYSTLLLVILFAASCGKKDADSEVVPPQAVAPLPPQQPIPNPPPTNGNDIQTWCWHQGGTFQNGICKIQDSQALSWNWLIGYNASNTFVYANDIVSVESDGSPRILVGNVDHGRNGTFVARSSGILAFNGSGFDSYRIRNIRITRCYSSIGSVACP